MGIIVGGVFLSLVITEVNWELGHAWRKIDMCGGMISFSLCSIYTPAPPLLFVQRVITTRELSYELSIHFKIRYRMDYMQYYSSSYYMW